MGNILVQEEKAEVKNSSIILLQGQPELATRLLQFCMCIYLDAWDKILRLVDGINSHSWVMKGKDASNK